MFDNKQAWATINIGNHHNQVDKLGSTKPLSFLPFLMYWHERELPENTLLNNGAVANGKRGSRVYEFFETVGINTAFVTRKWTTEERDASWEMH